MVDCREQEEDQTPLCVSPRCQSQEDLMSLCDRPLTDVLGNTMKKLTAKRSRARVVDKLLSMGLVCERRELYKKRSRKPQAKPGAKSSGRGMVR